MEYTHNALKSDAPEALQRMENKMQSSKAFLSVPPSRPPQGYTIRPTICRAAASRRRREVLLPDHKCPFKIALSLNAPAQALAPHRSRRGIK